MKNEDEEILMNYVEARKKILIEGEAILRELDSITESNFDTIIQNLKPYSCENIIKCLAKITMSRPADVQLYSTFIEKLSIENNKIINSLVNHIRAFPAPLVRSIYNKGVVSKDDVFSKITDKQGLAFTDLVPNFYDFAPDIPEIRITEDWVMTSCVPGSFIYLLKTDNVEAIASLHAKGEVKLGYYQYSYFETEFFHANIPNDKTMPIDMAAKYHSKKCFEYYRKVGCPIEYSTLQNAVFGGDEEIFNKCIDVVKNEDHNYYMAYIIALKYYRFKFIDWFEARHKYPVNVYSFPSKVFDESYHPREDVAHVTSEAIFLKAIEEKKNLSIYVVNKFIDNAPIVDQVPIARALLSRGLKNTESYSSNVLVRKLVFKLKDKSEKSFNNYEINDKRIFEKTIADYNKSLDLDVKDRMSIRFDQKNAIIPKECLIKDIQRIKEIFSHVPKDVNIDDTWGSVFLCPLIMKKSERLMLNTMLKMFLNKGNWDSREVFLRARNGKYKDIPYYFFYER